ncbi:hypothetical protein Ancab_018560, partial [Ancistrocladus abbreviatus]
MEQCIAFSLCGFCLILHGITGELLMDIWLNTETILEIIICIQLILISTPICLCVVAWIASVCRLVPVVLISLESDISLVLKYTSFPLCAGHCFLIVFYVCDGKLQKPTVSTASGSTFELALVMFYTQGPYSGCGPQRSGWTRDVDNFLGWLSSLTFSGGGLDDAAVAEGLSESLMSLDFNTMLAEVSPKHGYSCEQDLDNYIRYLLRTVEQKMDSIVETHQLAISYCTNNVEYLSFGRVANEYLSTLPFSAAAIGMLGVKMFAIPQNGYQTQQNLDGKRHCILIGATSPYPLKTPVYRPNIEKLEQDENIDRQTESHLYDAETVARWFGQCSVSLSVICPKQVPKLRAIYNA